MAPSLDGGEGIPHDTETNNQFITEKSEPPPFIDKKDRLKCNCPQKIRTVN